MAKNLIPIAIEPTGYEGILGGGSLPAEGKTGVYGGHDPLPKAPVSTATTPDQLYEDEAATTRNINTPMPSNIFRGSKS